MKISKYLMVLGFIFAISLNVSKAGEVNTAKDLDLSYQFRKEIQTKLALPMFLKFEDKNLKGIATAYISVMDNGKINLMRVESDNSSLREYLTGKINLINAWTAKKFAGQTLKYTINVK